MTDVQFLESILEKARIVPSENLPSFLGKLEEIRQTALSRLHAPAPAQVKPIDELLDVTKASARLGVSVHYLRRHPEQLRHLERPIGRKILYTSAGIQRFIEQRR